MLTPLADSLRALATNSPAFWGWVAIIGLVAVVAYYVHAEWRRDQWLNAIQPETDPEKIAATRAELRAGLIDHLRETEPDIDAELERRWRAGAAVRRGQDTPYTSPDPRLRIDPETAGLERLLRAVDGETDGAA